MKVLIASIIGRVIGYIATLGFVFGMVYITGSTGYLWLLLLLLTIGVIPTYDMKSKDKDDKKNAGADKKDLDDIFGDY